MPINPRQVDIQKDKTGPNIGKGLSGFKTIIGLVYGVSFQLLFQVPFH